MTDDRRDDSNQIAGIIESVLDRGFMRLMRPYLRGGTSPAMERRLNDLQTEAERLASEDKPLARDNPFVVALTVTLSEEMAQTAVNVRGLAQAVQADAVNATGVLYRQISLGNLADAQLAQIGIGFNQPDPDAMLALVDYVGRSEFADAMRISSDVVLRTVNNQIIGGVLNGWSPLRIAETVSATVRDLPISQVNTMMRTLQLSAYRQASFLYDQANADIIRRRIRIGTLDGRICMACLALYGTELRDGEYVTDHHNGRCTSISEIIPNIRPQIMTGEDYWRGLSDDEKRKLAGAGAYEALVNGRAQLRDFVTTYDDPLFGQMVRQRALGDVVAGA